MMNIGDKYKLIKVLDEIDTFGNFKKLINNTFEIIEIIKEDKRIKLSEIDNGGYVCVSFEQFNNMFEKI